MIRHVIWDWNGTLLDDVEHAITAINSLLEERGMPRVDTHSYRAQFGFPVRDFYEALGFDFVAEHFEHVSETFIARYKQVVATASVHTHGRATLAALRQHGVRQSVLSAMEVTMLGAMLETHGLTPYLDHVRGLDHLHATSKVDLGVDLMRVLAQDDLRPDEVLLVGDTLHDHETAAAMGCQCVLVAHGHQHETRLARTGARLLHSLAEVADHVMGSRGGGGRS
jgi:phosphoglycolate phosphatase